MFKKLNSIILIIIMILSLPCGGLNVYAAPSTTLYVHYETRVNNEVITQKYIKDEIGVNHFKIKEPQTPVRDGYIFDGWYINNNTPKIEFISS